MNIWELPSPVVMGKIANDPAYKALISHRDGIHNMDAVTLYFAENIFDTGDQVSSDKIMVDLVVMNEGYGKEDRDYYCSKIDEVGRKYGVNKKQSYQITKKIAGNGPEALRLNIWKLDDPTAFMHINKDAGYQKWIPLRDQIHNMSAVSIYMAQPAS